MNCVRFVAMSPDGKDIPLFAALVELKEKVPHIFVWVLL